MPPRGAVYGRVVVKENIVFFFSDQQRFDTLGCNGQPLDITPNIDALAAEGVNFTRAFTPQPVCGPARACLQTGVFPTETGCFRNAVPLPVGRRTLARYMRDAGYNVGYVGKWHLASGSDGPHYETLPVPPERRGGYDGFWYAADVLEFTSHGYGGYVYDKDGNKAEFTGYRTDCITDFAVRFIEEYDEDKPFFLFVSHIEPHHQNDRNSYEGPEGSKEKYDRVTAAPDLKPGEGDWEKWYPDYLGCCNALDRNLGRVVTALRKKGIYDDTMVIYTSDHGCHFKTVNDRSKTGADDYKRNSFENTIHVPLVIKGRNFSGGKTEEHVVSLIDLPPTLIEAAGGTRGNELQGRPLQDIFRGRDWNDEVYIQISESYVGRALRTARYKYVVWAPEKDPWNDSCSDIYAEKYLFDLGKDPLEKHNLLNDSGYADIKRQLKERLAAWAEKAGEGRVAICS